MDYLDVLGINVTDSDKIVRKQYLKLLKKYPPEHNKEKFIEIKTAYEKCKTEVERYQNCFFYKDLDVDNFSLLKRKFKDNDTRIPELKKIINLLKEI
jgi:curved DNA-binding protein CbpA